MVVNRLDLSGLFLQTSSEISWYYPKRYSPSFLFPIRGNFSPIAVVSVVHIAQLFPIS